MSDVHRNWHRTPLAQELGVGRMTLFAKYSSFIIRGGEVGRGESCITPQKPRSKHDSPGPAHSSSDEALEVVLAARPSTNSSSNRSSVRSWRFVRRGKYNRGVLFQGQSTDISPGGPKVIGLLEGHRECLEDGAHEPRCLHLDAFRIDEGEGKEGGTQTLEQRSPLGRERRPFKHDGRRTRSRGCEMSHVLCRPCRIRRACEQQ